MSDAGQRLDTVGKRLRYARAVLNGGVAATVVAPLIGVTNVTISRWETEATREIGADDLSNAARVYGVPLSWLANGGDPPLARAGKPLFEIKRSRARDTVARPVERRDMTAQDDELEIEHLRRALDECLKKHRAAVEEEAQDEGLIARLKARTEKYVAIMLELAADQPGHPELRKHLTDMLLRDRQPNEREDARTDEGRKTSNGGHHTPK